MSECFFTTADGAAHAVSLEQDDECVNIIVSGLYMARITDEGVLHLYEGLDPSTGLEIDHRGRVLVQKDGKIDSIEFGGD